ncbi:MAG: GDCCVxC domain-containing (seleno)protein [Caulobacteraceae bacterium]
MNADAEAFAPITESELTCPNCGERTVETMPTDACIWIFACPGCGLELRPLPGHCCVFCSYGSHSCPPIQIERAGGEAAPCGSSS